MKLARYLKTNLIKLAKVLSHYVIDYRSLKFWICIFYEFRKILFGPTWNVFLLFSQTSEEMPIVLFKLKRKKEIIRNSNNSFRRGTLTDYLSLENLLLSFSAAIVTWKYILLKVKLKFLDEWIKKDNDLL